MRLTSLVKQTMNDKSLFKFVSPNKRIVLATLHSDDVDLVCENPNDGVAIADAFNTRFGGDSDGAQAVMFFEIEIMAG